MTWQQQFSKDELSFVRGLPEHVNIECPICLNIITDPQLVSCCGYNFCESCIERVRASNGACPMCKEQDYQAVADRRCFRIINGMQIYCTNREKGCQWEGELRNLCIHLNTGKKNGECQYEEVKCKHEKCCEMHLRLHLHHHEDNECSERLILCEYCNKEDTVRFINEEHYKECLQYPVSCPNKCACMQMTRANLVDHVNNVCSLQPVECSFSWAGCNERPFRKDAAFHTFDSKHMILVAAACKEVQKSLFMLKEENASMKEELKDLRKENVEIKKNLQEKDDHVRSICHIVIKEKMLPIEITPESGVVHFYSGVCGQHMSVRAEISLNESFKGTSCICRLFFAFHKGVFDQFKLKHRKVFAQYEDKVVLLVDDTETTFKQSDPEILDKFTSHGPVPQGVLTKEIGESLFFNAFSVKLFTA